MIKSKNLVLLKHLNSGGKKDKTQRIKISPYNIVFNYLGLSILAAKTQEAVC